MFTFANQQFNIMKLLNSIKAARWNIIILLMTMVLPKINATNYVQIKAKNGDGMYNIFKKFSITPTQCNINQFKELNKLKSINKLLIGKQYQLPILKLNYNGKSILSSVPNINKSLASRISEYNKSVHQSGVRKSSYTQSKVLWVVYGDVYCGSSANTKTIAVNTVSRTTSSSKSSLSKVSVKTEIKPANSAPSLATKQKTVLQNKAEEITTPVFRENNEANTSEITSSVLKTRTVPIFGPDFEEIRIETNRLQGKVFYLVSGHGGPDPGTIFHGEESNISEDEYAYDITLRLARKLMEQGANVHLIVQDPDDGIRNETYLKLDKDEKCITGYPLVLNQRLRLTQTTDAVNDLYRKYRNKGVADKDQIAAHIHIDSRHEDMRKDVYFYYQEENKYSLAIAKRLRKTLDQKYQEFSDRDYTGTVSSRNLFVMRNTIPATVYMELGNMQNAADQKRFIYPTNRQALAEWLFDGIVGME